MGLFVDQSRSFDHFLLYQIRGQNAMKKEDGHIVEAEFENLSQDPTIRKISDQMRAAVNTLQSAYKNKNAPIGLKMVAYVYFYASQRHKDKAGLVLGAVLSHLLKDYSDFDLLEAPGLYLPYQKNQEEIIQDAISEHRDKEKEDYLNLGLISGIEAAKEGKLDEFIKRVVKSRLIDEKRRRQQALGKGQVFSLDLILNPTDTENEQVTLLETIFDPHAPDPADLFFDVIQLIDKECITENEREELEKIDGLNDTDINILNAVLQRRAQIEEEVARAVGCSQSRVSKGFKRLKKHKNKILKIFGILE